MVEEHARDHRERPGTITRRNLDSPTSGSRGSTATRTLPRIGSGSTSAARRATSGAPALAGTHAARAEPIRDVAGRSAIAWPRHGDVRRGRGIELITAGRSRRSITKLRDSLETLSLRWWETVEAEREETEGVCLLRNLQVRRDRIDPRLLESVEPRAARSGRAPCRRRATRIPWSSAAPQIQALREPPGEAGGTGGVSSPAVSRISAASKATRRWARLRGSVAARVCRGDLLDPVDKREAKPAPDQPKRIGAAATHRFR